MIITNDRSALNTALADNKSICVLRGSEQSDAGKVHNCMETGNWGAQPWQCWFLVTDDGELTPAELSAWYDDSGAKDYCFLGRNSNNVTSNGAAASDLLFSGDCDFIAFVDKFAEADLS